MRTIQWPNLRVPEKLLVGAGQISSRANNHIKSLNNIQIVAIDGGGHQKGIKPDVIIGDLDSIQNVVQKRVEEVVKIPEQNSTDLEKALKWCEKHGTESVDIVGIEGGDLTHELALFPAISSLISPMDVIVLMQRGLIANVTNTRTIKAAPKTKFSLLPFSGPVNLSLQGSTWPYVGELIPTSTRGFRNEVGPNGVVECSVANGCLFIIIDLIDF